jgi:hypothetical protein
MVTLVVSSFTKLPTSETDIKYGEWSKGGCGQNATKTNFCSSKSSNIPTMGKARKKKEKRADFAV